MTIHLNHTLQSSFEYDGTWWLAQNPDDSLPGKLTFSPDEGTRLALVGSFRQVPFVGNQAFHSDFINGVTEDGTECTLIDTYEVGRRLSFTRGGSHIFMANQLIIGGAYNDHKQPVFLHCQISFDHIEEWVTPSPFELTDISEEKRFVGFNVRLLTQEKVRKHLALTGVELSIYNRIGTRDREPTKVELINEVFVKIKSSIPNNLEIFQRWVSELGRLIGFLMGDITWPRKVHLLPAASSEKDVEKAASTVSLFFRPVLGPNDRRPGRYQMPVEFETFVSKLPAIADHWLSHDLGFQTVKNLFFYTLYSGDTGMTNTLLNLAHALESYHRCRVGGQYVDNETYETYRKKIVSGLPEEIPSDLKDALKGRIKYGNQFSLRKRLGDLLSSLEPNLRKLVTTKDAAFVNTVVAARNYNVHFDEEDEAHAVKGAGILYLNKRLELLLRILFLRELGFNDSEIQEMLEDKGRLLPLNQHDENYP